MPESTGGGGSQIRGLIQYRDLINLIGKPANQGPTAEELEKIERRRKVGDKMSNPELSYTIIPGGGWVQEIIYEDEVRSFPVVAWMISTETGDGFPLVVATTTGSVSTDWRTNTRQQVKQFFWHPNMDRHKLPEGRLFSGSDAAYFDAFPSERPNE